MRWAPLCCSQSYLRTLSLRILKVRREYRVLSKARGPAFLRFRVLLCKAKGRVCSIMGMRLPP